MVVKIQDLALQPISARITKPGIDENISVGYKGEIIFAHNQFQLFWPDCTGLLSAICIPFRP